MNVQSSIASHTLEEYGYRPAKLLVLPGSRKLSKSELQAVVAEADEFLNLRLLTHVGNNIADGPNNPNPSLKQWTHSPSQLNATEHGFLSKTTKQNKPSQPLLVKTSQNVGTKTSQNVGTREQRRSGQKR